jgi:acetate kinase
MREIEDAAFKDNNERALLGLDMYHYRVKKYIGAYAAAMGGVDIIIFAGGVGENGPETREEICSDLEFLGAEIDLSKNKGLRSKEAVISKDGSRVKIMVVPTNEELVIAEDTVRIINELGKN